MGYRIADGDRGVEINGKRFEPGDLVDTRLDDDTIGWLTGKGLLVEVATPTRRTTRSTTSVEDGE